MKIRLQKRIGALALALSLAASLCVPALAADTAERAASAAQYAQSAMTMGGADNVSYAVWEDGEITAAGGVGAFSRTENRALIPDDALYGIGSVSKVYTAAAVMKLAEAGKIKLDAPVTAYLKDFKMADPRFASITVRMLLNHSSGLMGTTGQNAFLFADADEQATDELLKRLSTQKLKADPGAFSAYCNDGFTLAQLVVEAVSGRDFMAYVREELLAPAGLENTYAPQDAFDADRLVRTYAAAADSRALPQDCLGIVGAGGMYATAYDLAAFGGALTGTKLLSEASTAAMAAPEYDRGIWPDEPLGAVSYGLGWDSVEFWPFQQNGIQCLVKGGDTLRYHAGLVVLPEHHMAAAVLSSGGVSGINEMAAAQMLADALEAKGVKIDQTAPALPEAKPAAMPAALVEESGYYGVASQQIKATVTADGKLVIHQLSMAGVPDQTLTYYSDGSFRGETGMFRVKLVKERNGRTYFYQQMLSTVPGLGVLPTSDYLLVKMPENQVDPQVQAAWDKLTAAGAVPLGEKYSSQLYLELSSAAVTAAATAAAYETAGVSAAAEAVPGYVGGQRIVGASELIYDLPVGRDGSFTAADGDKLWIGGAPYLREDSLKDISAKSGAVATIQPDGYARWFRAGGAAGRTMTVTLPENAGFCVYDAKGVLAASSLLWGDKTAAVPQGGLIVFAGDPGARFQLQFSK